jgi:hypothetical protein
VPAVCPMCEPVKQWFGDDQDRWVCFVGDAEIGS